MSHLAGKLDKLKLPLEVTELAAERLGDIVRQSPAQAKRLAALSTAPAFLKALATSDYFAQTLLRRPLYLDALVHAAEASSRDVLSQAPRPIQVTDVDPADPEAQQAELRFQRHLNMLLILWRANGHLCRLESTLIELSALADGLIRQAVSASHRRVASSSGEPVGASGQDQLCVLAMGKLGGAELNVSSDVDLILMHSEPGETRGARTLSSTEFFSRQAKVLTGLLAQLTPDGFCYRVDTRLRPFGTSGHPCVHFAALEQYLGVHGREWERYAYIKQRALTGTAHQRRELAALLRPFVYRKYLDYGVFEELRSMKALIDTEVQRNELKDDIKRGPGGIRELEFMVQTLQLVFGGRYPALQTPSFFAALKGLTQLSYLTPEVARSMHEDYCFLRRVENGVQGLRDEQTHVLPEQRLDQQRLAVLMQTESYDQLLEQLEVVRHRVQRQFDDLRMETSVSSDDAMSAAQIFATVEKHDALASLRSLKQLRQRLESVGRKRLDVLMPRVVDLLSRAPDAEAIAPRFATLLSGIGRRSAYFSLMTENPAVLDRVLSICRQSPRLAAQLSQSPMLLDTLADPRGSSVALDRAALAARLRQQMVEKPDDDEEQPLIALREFHKLAVFDVAVADMEQQMSLMNVSDRLTDIAELVLEEALRLATSDMQARFGVPRSDQGRGEPAQFAIVGYGKLGGIELGYSSDLDLVFLYDDDSDGVTDGARSVDNSVYFSRLSRRLIQILTVPTRAGTLYEVDMRLRPSGRSGLLVSRLGAFTRYQQKEAWTWEHQALIRARAVAGDSALCESFERFRRDHLGTPRDGQQLREDVRAMRTKMKSQLDRSTALEFDLKQGAGGLVDLEFLVQYLVLANAGRFPELVRYSDNVRQLEVIGAASLLGAADSAALRDAYLTFRQRLHRRALAGQSRLVPESEFSPERTLIANQLKAHELAL